MSSEITFPEKVFDDYPARVRIVVDEDDGEDQRGLIWGFRNRYYSSAPTARLAYQAEDLNPIGGATKVATSGASGGTAVRLAPLWPAWTPVLNTNKGGTAYLTHQGTYRAFMRCIIAGTLQTQARLSWDVGDLVNPVVNDPVTIPSPGNGTTKGTTAFTANLGEVRLDASPVGVHRWQGQIDAHTYNTAAGTADFRLDRFWLQPVDEGAGMLTASLAAPSTPSVLTAFDDFGGAGTALAATTAPLGGNWDPGTAGGSTAEDGDTDDFSTSGSPNFNVTRSAAADSSLTNGRYEVLSGSSTISKVEIQVDVSLPTFTTGSKEVRGGLLARFVDTDNWLMAVRRNITTAGSIRFSYLSLFKRVAGTVTDLATAQLVLGNHQTGVYTLKLTVDASGNFAVYTAPQGSNLGDAVITGQDTTHLQTGQTLDDGKVGIYDATTLGLQERTYDNFQASVPSALTSTSDAVIYANRSAQLTTDGHYRLDSGGTAYGPVSIQSGDLPRLPVSGLEGRTTEIFIKSSRGDFDQLPDSGIDDVSARVYFRPSYLTLGTI